MVVQVGADETGKLYTAMPLLNTKLSESDQLEQIQSTVGNALRIYYKLKRKGVIKKRFGTNEWFLPLFIPLREISKFLVENENENYDNFST